MSMLSRNCNWLLAQGMADLVQILESHKGDYTGKAYDQKVVDYMLAQLRDPRKVVVQRHANDQCSTLTPSEVSERLVDVHHSILLDNSPFLAGRYNVNSNPIDYIFLSSMGLAVLENLPDAILPQFRSVIIVEYSYSQLAAILHEVDLPRLVERIRLNNIGFNLLIDSDEKILCEKIFFQVSESQPLSLSSLGVIRPLKPSKILSEVENFIFDEARFAQRFIACLGSTSDDLNHLRQATLNLSQHQEAYKLETLPALNQIPVLITGSGPSLDNSLETIKRIQSLFHIIAAGSSLGSLLEAGIVPQALVLLERSLGLYEEYEAIVERYPDIREMPLIASISIDPRLPKLFPKTIFYSRPGLSYSTLFSMSDMQLSIAGPESVNAAVDSALRLGYKRIHLIGCDFGAEERHIKRSVNAISSAYRRVDEPSKGNHGKTVYSDPTLMYAKESLCALLSYYADPDVIVKRHGIGVPIGAKNVQEDPEINLLCGDTAVSPPGNIPSFSTIMSSKLSHLTPIGATEELQSLLLRLQAYFNTLETVVNSLDPYSSVAHTLVSDYLSLFSSGSDKYRDTLKLISRETLFHYFIRFNDLGMGDPANMKEHRVAVALAISRLSSVIQSFIVSMAAEPDSCEPSHG